jgi:hypothetical protein
MPSSVIRAFDYDPLARRLTVAFISGRIYIYDEVPAVVAEEFRHAAAKGVFFNFNIRDKYRYREVRRRAA